MTILLCGKPSGMVVDSSRYCLAEYQESAAEFVNNTEGLVVSIGSTSQLAYYRSSIVFAYVDYCPYSSDFSALVFAAAQAFPHLRFLALKVQRLGHISTSLGVSVFPALVYNSRNRNIQFFGNYSSTQDVLRFIAFASATGPVSWHPPGIKRVPAAEGERYLTYPFLVPSKPDPPYAGEPLEHHVTNLTCMKSCRSDMASFCTVLARVSALLSPAAVTHLGLTV